MRHDDGDDPRDPVLDSMRTVWLSMREQDPPARGLTELLAAARAKAEAMQPTLPWWRRLVTALRRPPMLALATTVVLVGGAVMIGMRDELEPAPIEVARPRLALTTTPAPDDEPGGRPGVGPVAPDGASVVTADQEKSTEREFTGSGRVPLRGPVARPPSPDRATGEAAVKVERKDQVANVDGDFAKPAGAAPGVLGKTASAVAEPQGLVIAQDPHGPVTGGGGGGLATAPPPPDRVSADDHQVVSSAAARDDLPTSSHSAAPARRAGAGANPSVEQLARQSVTAAARGDCPAVRAIMSRIRKLDGAFYTDHVASNAAIKRCIW